MQLYLLIVTERDSKFVLDYLRYEKLSLPITVSREMFLMDIDYYGLNSSEDGTTVNNRPRSGIDENYAIKEVALHVSKYSIRLILPCRQ